ncbi:MAG: threonine/serine dehydratase [Proteobacteria bacterium]|nr:threonine/serine dehydratase [Pseudomonadota bacterium]
MAAFVTLDAVRAAAERIAPYVRRTPVLTARPKDDCELLCKAESLQATGAFKLRGAFSKLLALPADAPGVVAHSSGNHAQAVARAARVLGIRAVIVMPADAPPPKRERTEADGAEIVAVGPDSDERERVAATLAQGRGLVLVPPFDDPLVAAGQGTAALELLEETGALDRFYAPVSGGGLMAGCAVVVHGLSPAAEIVGVEPEDGNDTQLSLAAGERRKVPPPRTIADGLRVRTPGAGTWPVLKQHLARVELVSDRELEDAMRYALHELHLVLEPSGAASLAVALREGRGRCGVLLSGGNVDPTLLAAVAARERGRWTL